MIASAAVESITIVIDASQPSGAAVGLVESAESVLVGRRVLVGPMEPCGLCDVCGGGGAAVCTHATAREPGTRISVSSRWAVPLGDGLELPLPAAAAVGGDVATAYTLYARTGLSSRDPVVVTGATAITRFLVEILRAKGMTPVVLARDAAWLTAKGAVVVAEPSEIAAAMSAQGLGTRPLRVIAVDPETLAVACSLAGPRATLTVLAATPVPTLDGRLRSREVTVVGVAGPHPDLIVEVAAMCAKGEIDLAGGVTTDPGDRTRAFVISARG